MDHRMRYGVKKIRGSYAFVAQRVKRGHAPAVDRYSHRQFVEGIVALYETIEQTKFPR